MSDRDELKLEEVMQALLGGGLGGMVAAPASQKRFGYREAAEEARNIAANTQVDSRRLLPVSCGNPFCPHPLQTFHNGTMIHLVTTAPGGGNKEMIFNREDVPLLIQRLTEEMAMIEGEIAEKGLEAVEDQDYFFRGARESNDLDRVREVLAAKRDQILNPPKEVLELEQKYKAEFYAALEEVTKDRGGLDAYQYAKSLRPPKLTEDDLLPPSFSIDPRNIL